MLIEHFLIDALGRKVMAYTLQDLQCTKCSEVWNYLYFNNFSKVNQFNKIVILF